MDTRRVKRAAKNDSQNDDFESKNRKRDIKNILKDKVEGYIT